MHRTQTDNPGVIEVIACSCGRVLARAPRKKVMYAPLLFSIDFRLHFTVGLCTAYMVRRRGKD